MPVLSRKRKNPPDLYNGWTVVRLIGCYFGVPEHLDADLLDSRPDLRSHPAVLKALTRPALLALIDRQERTIRPVDVGRCDGYDLIRHGSVFHAVPHGAGPVDLEVDEERRQAGVVSAGSAEELRDRLRALRDAVPVEFAGWLPIYKLMGNCGHHPQFAHTFRPPEGYHFTRSVLPESRGPSDRGKTSWMSRCAGTVVDVVRGGAVAAARGMAALVRPILSICRPSAKVSPRARIRLMVALIRLFFLLVRGGGRLPYVLRFLKSRHFTSQALLAEPRQLVFLTSAPYTYNQNPWVIEVEDPTTLFFPFVHNGQTAHINVADSPYFPIVRTLLESDQCRMILTHMRSSARLIANLFRSEAIARKIRYLPIGVEAPRRWQRHDKPKPEPINLLYINSWSQHPGNVQVRGGLDVLEAFSILRERYPHVRLTMRTSLIPLDDHYHRIIEDGWVRIINRFLTTEEMEDLHAESHIYLLPAARIHIVSLLQAMAAGLAVVASDGWGFSEYVAHERNGLIVKGRYGKTSWADESAGMLRENYEPTYSPDLDVVNGIVEAVSRLVEDDDLRRRLGRTARHDVETTYNLENWNRGLKAVLDEAVGR